ncbi:hypothetical protein P8605_02065 [Streptomyces sp. T-3]|nr:hypothetical protein [Streptomyces sp. T-3]
MNLLRRVPEPSEAAYATDGTDFGGALKYHYVAALKRFAKYAVVFAPMFVLVLVSGLKYLLPVAIVGFLGLVVVALFFWSALAWTWRCSRVFRRYPLTFRTPVRKLQQKANGTRVLAFGESGGEGSPEMLSIDPLSRSRWPKGIEDGVWFAGDDTFGGAALVPGTGELLFMQPDAWGELAGERTSAGPERTKRARRAGIKRRVAIR